MNVEQRTRRFVCWGGPVVLLVGSGLVGYVAGAAAVAAAASVITALAAIGALWVAHKNLRHLVEDSRDRTRPYVYLELVPGLWGSAAVDLIVANFGESMAYDVSLEFKNIDWDAPLTAGEPDEVRPFIEKGLVGKSMVIPPHGRRRFAWQHQSDESQPRKGMPHVCDVTVTYAGPKSDVRSAAIYSNEFTLTTETHPAVPTPQRGLHREGKTVETELHNLDNVLRQLNVHVGELRR